MRLFLFLLCVVFTFSVTAQSRFTITYNQGFGQFPTFSDASATQNYNPAEANRIFKFLKDTSAIEWAYPYAGCEKRAHAASLLLNGKKISHYKIWNFDPSYISLFNKQQKLTTKNNTGIGPDVVWRYHVAIMIYVSDGATVRPMVIDPALSGTILTPQEWLNLQNAPTSFYTYLDARWYNYATTDKFKYKCGNSYHAAPPCMDALLTGDFFLNDGISLSDLWVEEALTVNKIAMEIINSGLIKKDIPASERRKAFTELVENFNALTEALKETKYPDNIIPYQNLLVPYQLKFKKLRGEWKIRLDALR